MILVIGGGIFGVTAALELRARGEEVTLVDAGAIPNPLAESTDISKAVRMDYGGDAEYVERMERALDGWRAWNARWKEDLFHEDGIAFLTPSMDDEGTFERTSFELLRSRNHTVERLDARSIAARFPAWTGSPMRDGYFNPHGGFVESGRVVARLAKEARERGVIVKENARIDSIDALDADAVVVAAGAWASRLVPSVPLRDAGQPVFHLRPSGDPSLFEAKRFPTFGADIARTGWYGFPLHEGVVKIANHGPGRAIHPDTPSRDVPEDEERSLRAFLRSHLPMLAEAPIVFRRTCIYGDTPDEHFWIARHPDRPNVTVATGGSGHAFKFAPLLGHWIANAVLGVRDPDLEKFRWREAKSGTIGEESARKHGGTKN